MTLTSLLPTLRESLPVPFSRDAWPARTAAGTRDVCVGGVSLLRYVELCGTPSVLTADAVIPQSGGVVSTVATTSVVVAGVVSVTGADTVRALQVDASLAGLPYDGSQLRLLGRVSHAADVAWVVTDRDGTRMALDAPRLPEDLRPGDLLALPCRGAIALGDLRPHPAPGR